MISIVVTGGTMEELRFTHGTYRSTKKSPGFFAKIFPSAFFYAHILKIVFIAGSRAKQHRYGRAEWIRSSLDTVDALEKLGILIEISGIDSFRALDGPCIFIGNHMSTLETFVLPSIIAPFKEVTFVVKQSLVEYPVFKHVMRSRNPVVVGRENAREDLENVLTNGTALLKQGTSLIIFPQTTRTTEFDTSQFNTIGIKLARKADVPIVPVALRTDAWGAGKLVRDFGKIDPSRKVFFAFGEPLRVTDRGAEEHKKIIKFIVQRLESWGMSPVRSVS